MRNSILAPFVFTTSTLFMYVANVELLRLRVRKGHNGCGNPV